MIEIKCGEGKIVIGDPCPPVQSFSFPADQEEIQPIEVEKEENDTPQSS
jgi:hypothetical protein